MDKTFTIWKFGIIKTLMADGEISHAAFRVGICILQHINSKTRIARLSDETIRDKIGGLSKCRIIEARNQLKDQGWIIWYRPDRLKENYYRFIGIKIEAIRDEQTAKADMRKERWSKRGTIVQVQKEVLKTIPPEPLRGIENDMSGGIENASSLGIENDTYTPMKDYTFNSTPIERGPSEQKVSVVDRGIMIDIIGTTVGSC